MFSLAAVKNHDFIAIGCQRAFQILWHRTRAEYTVPGLRLIWGRITSVASANCGTHFGEHELLSIWVDTGSGEPSINSALLEVGTGFLHSANRLAA